MYRPVELPRRPALPVSLYALIGAVMTERTIVGEGVAGLGSMAAKVAWGLVGASVCMAAALLLKGGERRVPTVLVVAFAVAMACVSSTAQLRRGEAFCAAMGQVPVSACAVEVLEDTHVAGQGLRARARVQEPGGTAGDVWLGVSEPLARGTRLRCVGAWAPNADDEWGDSSRMQGVWGSLRVRHIVLREEPQAILAAIGRLRQRILESIAPAQSTGRALLGACVCGSKDQIRAEGLDKLFSRCGMAHMVAVSGSHLALVTALMGSVLQKSGMRPKGRTAALLAASFAFVLFCGLPVSAVRAWAMSAVASVGGLMGRRSHALSGVAAVALCMALADPGVCGQLGFLLSVVATCALCVYAPYVTYALGEVVGSPSAPRALPVRLRRKWAQSQTQFLETAAASLVALVATLPASAAAFGTVSVVGPVANALLGLPFGAFMALGVLACATFWLPQVQGLMLVAIDLVGGLIVRAMGILSRLPGAEVSVGGSAQALAAGVWAVGICLVVWWPHVSRRKVRAAVLACALGGALLFVRWRYFAPARICVLDVGQGDAILVQDGASAVLVDTGPDDSCAQALAREHVWHVDAIVLTHLHADHTGGEQSVRQALPCGQTVVAEGVDVPDGVAMAYGDVLTVGHFRLRAVSPATAVDGDENEESLVLDVSYDEGGRRLRALLTGDAEQDVLDAISSRGDLADVDLLKVGHHGSEVSLNDAQAQVLKPEVAVASAGVDNRYGHPRRECVDTLERAGALFLCTAEVGDVEVRPGADGPEVLYGSRAGQ